MKRRRPLAAALMALSLAAAPNARAEEPAYSPYEQDTIDDALDDVGGEIDPAPAGKRIESVEIVTLDVIEKRDPIPGFFNVFHITSRPWIIRRELLFSSGQRYDVRRVEESARNLRALRQLSLVLIVPLVGSTPNSVRILVITKDVWSLRLNTDFQYVDGKLTSLLLQPAEENVLGTHTMVGGLFVMEPATYSLGLQFIDRRVAGSRMQGIVSGNIIFNRDTGAPEGSFGSFSYGRPLFSAETKWAFKAIVTWRQEIFRSFIGDTLRTYDADATAADDQIPYQYDSERYYGVYLLTRSFGRRLKNDVSVGVEADRRFAKATDLSGADPAAASEFVRTQLPVSDTRVSPLVQLRSYTSDYHRVLDFETLGLQEDYRLGHEIVLRAYPASKAVGSTRNLLGSFVSAGYTAPLGDGLARAIVSNTYELSTQSGTDALLELNTRVVTPRLGFGRLVYDGLLLNRYENYYNELFTMGGSTRLRGYPPEAFIGKDVVASNLEYRSRPLEVLSTQLGAAAFYDVGDAFDGFSTLRVKHSVGLGFRALIPQANRIVFRADWGFPLSDGYRPLPGSLFVTFGQAFDMPTASPPTLAADFLD